jgi:N-acetylmuramoyl-L-alanine amidase
MGKMIAKVVLLFLFCTSLLFSAGPLSEAEILYKKIPYASKAQTREILHDLENLYINAVVEGNKEKIKASLKGIIKCQKLLGMDSSTYEKELSLLSPSYNKQPKTTAKPAKGSYYKNTSSTLPLRIRSIKKQEDSIVIKFDRPMEKSQILSFEINKNGVYKDIYDLKANLNFQSPKITIPGINKIKIAQNRRDKVRIVLEDSQKIYSKAFIRNGTLFIKTNKSVVSKPTYTPPPKKVLVPKTKTVRKGNKSAVYASSKTIVIDAGHGGKDGGAVGYKKYTEKVAVLKVAQLLKGLLKKQGYKVYLTRDNDTFVRLPMRTKYANDKKADLFISIHANAAPDKQKLSLKGIETFFLSPAKTEKAKRIAAKENAVAIDKMDQISQNTLLDFLNRNKIVQSNKLAIDIQGGILSKVKKKYDNVRDGGVREAPFWVLVGAQMPAVLVEMGYITNPAEAERLFNPFYQKALAEGIRDGINNYFINNP